MASCGPVHSMWAGQVPSWLPAAAYRARRSAGVRPISIRGLFAGWVGGGELRDLEASELRQKASLAPSAPFGLIALDGHSRRPIATPILALLAALSGREVAIVTDPPLLIFDVAEVPLPEL